jgi:ADP-heptose:LPS heptosyltransferase
MDKSCIKKIGIFRALQLGDLMCSIPAIRALRAEFPNAEIFLISLPSAKSMVYRFPQYFNGLIKFPGFPGLPEQPYNISVIVDFIHDMQRQRFDLILQMQGNGNIINPLIELFGAYYTVGFYRESDYIPKGNLFMPYPGGHEIERHLALMNHLGIESKGKHLEFPLNSKDENELKEADLMFEPGSYVCIHPGSRGSWRQWPPENFARIADMCADKGKRIVITGTSDEISIAMETAALMINESILAAGSTTLGALGVLIKNAFALISNCTGVSHIASALNTPGIIISMDGEPERWGPLNKDILHTIDWLTEPHFYKAELALKELFEKHQGKEAGAYK